MGNGNKFKKYLIMSKFYVPARRFVYITLGTINKTVPSYKTKIFILCYHGIGNDSWAFSVRKTTFEKQMKYLLSQKYEFITLSKLNAFVSGKEMIEKPSVVITFDDGYKDILSITKFVKKHNIKPCLFLLSNTKNANRQELANNREFLNKKDIAGLVSDGWELGSHTATHSDMNILTNSQIKEEIVDSKEILEKDLNTKIRYIAYPKGRYNSKILKSARKAGYELGLTMDDGKIRSGMEKLLIPRIGVDRTHSYEEFRTLFLPLVISARGVLKSIGYGK